MVLLLKEATWSSKLRSSGSRRRTAGGGGGPDAVASARGPMTEQGAQSLERPARAAVSRSGIAKIDRRRCRRRTTGASRGLAETDPPLSSAQLAHIEPSAVDFPTNHPHPHSSARRAFPTARHESHLDDFFFFSSFRRVPLGVPKSLFHFRIFFKFKR